MTTPRLSLELYARLVDGLHAGVYVVDRGVFVYVNHALAELAGGRPEDIVGKTMPYMIAPEDQPLLTERYRRRLAGEAVEDTYEFSVLRLDRVTRIPVFMQTRTIDGPDGPLSVGSLVPLALHRTAAAIAAEHRAVLGADGDAARLAIPILQIHARALVVPVVGHVDAARAALLMGRLLTAIAEHRAREVIVDITGVPVVDERVAAYFVRTAHAVRLLGARLTLAGIAPAIARALVDAGDLRGLATTGSLEDAWQAAARRLAADG